MGRRPIINDLRRDVKERLSLVRAKFADLKHHVWKPKRYVPDITEVVGLLAKRTGLGESTLWNSRTPYLADIKRLLSIWEGECKELVARDQGAKVATDESGVFARSPSSADYRRVVDALIKARDELEREQSDHEAARERIKWLEEERRVIEQELSDATDELEAARKTIQFLQRSVPTQSY